MLEVRLQDDQFVVFDTEAGEAVVRFGDRRDADQLVAELQVQDLHSALLGWSHISTAPDLSGIRGRQPSLRSIGALQTHR